MSLAAASLALRGSGKISAATRARVEEAARSLRYTPNPLAAAFQSQIRRGGERRFQATLAWINDHPAPDYWHGRALFDCAKRRAECLGYALDEISVDPGGHMNDPGWLAERFCRVLRARGIHAAILPDLYRSALAAEPWDGFAVVLIGHYEAILKKARVSRTREVRQHAVRTHEAWNTREAFQVLRARGATRIGLVLTRWDDDMTDFEITARFLELQRNLPKTEQIAPLVIDGLDSAAGAVFEKWLKRHRPDAILCAHDEILRWLRHSGKAVPAEIRIAHLNRHGGPLAWSGIDGREDRLAEAAIDILTAHLVRNETGTPAYPKTVLIKGEWKPGATA